MGMGRGVVYPSPFSICEDRFSLEEENLIVGNNTKIFSYSVILYKVMLNR